MTNSSSSGEIISSFENITDDFSSYSDIQSTGFNILYKAQRYGKWYVLKGLKPFKKSVKTITTDNGGEFSHHKDISKALSAQIFFTDPYASWQKGAIENTNKLIRQYITKNQSIKLISQNDLALIQLKLNNRPRKKLNFQTPSAIFYNFAG